MMPFLRASIAAFCLLPAVALSYSELTHFNLAKIALKSSEATEGSPIYSLFEFDYDDAEIAVSAGAYAEDAAFTPMNHFFNPITNRGLSSAELNCLPLNCNPSPDWIIDGKGQPNPSVPEIHSWGQAISLHESALTAASKEERIKSAELMFVELGHVLHHIQDMAQPQHVRNDDHCDNAFCKKISKYRPSAYERFVHSQVVKGKLPSSGPAEFSITDADSPFKTLRDFWDGPKGLAVFTNSRFVSILTNFVPASSKSHGGCNDELEFCSPSAFAFPSAFGTELVPIAFSEELYIAYPKDSTKYIISQYSLLSLRLRGRLALDDLVYASTSNVLLSKALGYSSGIVNYFFRGRFSASVNASGNVVVTNAGAGLPRGTWRLFYDDPNGIRRPTKWSWVSDLPQNATVNTDLAPPIVESAKGGQFVMVYDSPPGPHGVGDRLVAGAAVSLMPMEESPKGFWDGSYKLTECNTPGYPGAGACAYVLYNVKGGGEGDAYAGPQRLLFATGMGGSHPRFEHFFNVPMCSTGLGNADGGPQESDLGKGGTFVNRRQLKGLFFNEQDHADITFTITSRSATEIKGVFSSAFTYAKRSGDGSGDLVKAPGTLKGEWSVKRRETSFPKCQTDGANFCTFDNRQFYQYDGYKGECIYGNPDLPADDNWCRSDTCSD